MSHNTLVDLTFAGPHRSDDMVLHTEDDGRHDDSSQGGLGYEGTVGHEEGQTDNDQKASVDASKGRLDSTGAVHCCS